MNQQCDFGVEFAECGVSRQRNRHQVSHAAYIHHHLVRAFIGKPAAELSNHRPPVLPLSLRPSTRRGLGYRAGKSDTPLLAEGTVRLWRTLRATKLIYAHERNAVVPGEGTLTRGRWDPIGKHR